MSRVSRSPTLMPTALASTRCEMRAVDFTAISAAIQPPNETPTTTRRAGRAPPSDRDRNRRGRRRWSAPRGSSERPKPGCDGAISRAAVGERGRAPAPAASMPMPGCRKRIGRPLAALDHLELRPVDRDRRVGRNGGFGDVHRSLHPIALIDLPVRSYALAYIAASSPWVSAAGGFGNIPGWLSPVPMALGQPCSPLPACGERVGVRGRFRESETWRISFKAQPSEAAPW